jgi:hypothetical protein
MMVTVLVEDTTSRNYQSLSFRRPWSLPAKRMTLCARPEGMPSTVSDCSFPIPATIEGEFLPMAAKCFVSDARMRVIVPVQVLIDIAQDINDCIRYDEALDSSL